MIDCFLIYKNILHDRNCINIYIYKERISKRLSINRKKKKDSDVTLSSLKVSASFFFSIFFW